MAGGAAEAHHSRCREGRQRRGYGRDHEDRRDEGTAAAGERAGESEAGAGDGGAGKRGCGVHASNLRPRPARDARRDAHVASWRTAEPSGEAKTSRRRSRMTATAVQQRLDSWKEIAAHLGRRVRTVQRWEREEGLPVRRHAHRRRGTVYALVDELDAWHLGRQRAPGEGAAAASAEGRRETTREPLAAAPDEPAPNAAPDVAASNPAGRLVAPTDTTGRLATVGTVPAAGPATAPRHGYRRLAAVAAAVLVAASSVVAARLNRPAAEPSGADPEWALTARYLVERGGQAEIERARDLCSR